MIHLEWCWQDVLLYAGYALVWLGHLSCCGTTAGNLVVWDSCILCGLGCHSTHRCGGNCMTAGCSYLCCGQSSDERASLACVKTAVSVDRFPGVEVGVELG